eukprot:3373129-Alexandrium_andersonii.AAC.1
MAGQRQRQLQERRNGFGHQASGVARRPGADETARNRSELLQTAWSAVVCLLLYIWRLPTGMGG